jgi:hypothetical protein
MRVDPEHHCHQRAPILTSDWTNRCDSAEPACVPASRTWPMKNDAKLARNVLTGHGHVLVEIARNPDARIRDISPAVGLTERTVQGIVADLEAAGYLTRTRVGRRTPTPCTRTARSGTAPRTGSGSARSWTS